jgi:hypothetical protein
MSKYENILNKLNVPKEIIDKTKRYIRPKIQNRVKNNVVLKDNYNFMQDLLELPKNKEGYKYLVVLCDIANNAFDIEPIKSKTPKSVLDATLEMFKRKYISKPYASIRTDGGNEFKGVYSKWMYDNNILHKVGVKNTQLANVERLNGELAYLFNEYMNAKEKETGKVYREWTDVIDIVRHDLNKLRKIDLSKISYFDQPIFNAQEPPKYKIGDLVYYKLQEPENILGTKQNTSNFRMGDVRWSLVARKIVKVIFMNDKPYYRYILSEMPNVSFSEYELKPAKETEETYKLKKIIGKKTEKRKIYYLCWWKGYKKAESTWEPKTELIKDGLKDEIDEYEKSIHNLNQK